jgi:hypothetical protein
MCDVAGADGASREIIAFVGGLDVTMGRYDTSQHPVMPGPTPEFAEDYRSVRCPFFEASSCHASSFALTVYVLGDSLNLAREYKLGVDAEECSSIQLTSPRAS